VEDQIMPRVLPLILLAWLPGVAGAGEKEIVERLEKKGECEHASSADGLPVTVLSLNAGYGDADLADLCELRSLAWLNLHGAGFTDAGLRRLHGFNHLFMLNLVDCPNVTPAAVEQLRRALPRCQIRVH
jgi:hypothetical protein